MKKHLRTVVTATLLVLALSSPNAVTAEDVQTTPVPLALALPGFRTEPVNGTYTIIGGFEGNSVDPGAIGSIVVGGGIENEPNLVTGDYSSVVGGRSNVIDGSNSFIGGGNNNTIAPNTAGSAIVGGLNHSIEASTSFIGGGNGNRVESGALVATVSGGLGNSATGTAAVIGGGQRNRVTDDQGTIAGGTDNLAGSDDGELNNAPLATVSGGAFNTAGGPFATVGGGNNNRATGFGGTVPGGIGNKAEGKFSFAAGQNAQALHDGSFVWSDGTPQTQTRSTAPNQFIVRATGGYLFSTGNFTGAVLRSGSGGWLAVSDRNVKEHVEPVDERAILEAVVALPVSTWNYKAQDDSIRHIGPMAQDFYAAFGVGEDERYIGTIDADGVALAAIKGLHRLVQEQRVQMQAQIDALEARIAALEAN